MYDKILINKKMIPYTFDLALDDGGIYTLFVNYNERGDFFTLALYKNGELLAGNQPIHYGVTLFSDVFQVDIFPVTAIVALDESNDTDMVTYDNFNKVIFLCVDDVAPNGGDTLWNE